MIRRSKKSNTCRCHQLGALIEVAVVPINKYTCVHVQLVDGTTRTPTSSETTSVRRALVGRAVGATQKRVRKISRRFHPFLPMYILI
jgi:hypothetical protein